MFHISNIWWNVKKTKEIVFDFRVKQNFTPSDHALSIDDTDVKLYL